MKQNFVIFRKTPLSALWAAQSEFSSPRHISGHAIIKMPRLHLSCGSAVAQIGGAGAKARFCLRENYFLLYPEFYILHFTFTICAGARARTLCGAADDRGGLWRGHHKRAGANVARWGASPSFRKGVGKIFASICDKCDNFLQHLQDYLFFCP